MGISRYLNPEVISPNKEYISVGNLKQDVLDLIGSSGGEKYDEAISELNQKIDSNIDRIDSILTEKESYPIPIKYKDLVSLAINNTLIPGQKYEIIDYKTTISQPNISVVDDFVIGVDDIGLFNMSLYTYIIVEADSTSTLKEDARLIRNFFYAGDNNGVVYSNSFNRSYEVKYDLHPTGTPDSSKVGFVPSGQFVTLPLPIIRVTDAPVLFEEKHHILEYRTLMSYYCTDYTLSAYDENNVLSNFLQFSNGTDKVYVRMGESNQYNEYPELIDGTPIYKFIDGGTSNPEDDTCVIIGQNVFREYTGYVYHMKDEFGNEADYEFDIILKNVNNEYCFTFGSIYSSPTYSMTYRGLYKNNKIYGTYNPDSKLMIDYNTIQIHYFSQSLLMMNNVISENCNNCSIGGGPVAFVMNNFIGELCNEVHIQDSSNNNVGFNSMGITIFSSSDGNEIGSNSRIVNIVSSSHNTLGNNLEGIEVTSSSYNVIGDISRNIYLSSSSENRIENRCSDIRLLSSSYNTFGMMCSDIIFGGNFINNRVGNDVSGIRFKTSASLNATDLTNIRYANIGDGVKGLVLYTNQINDVTGTSFYQNFDIANGLSEFKIDEPKFLQLSIPPNSKFMTYITKDTLGYNIMYNDGDVVNKTNEIGDITKLNTENKTSVVAAVNEVNDAIEQLSKIKYFSSYNDFTNAQKQPGTLYVIGCN